MAPLCGGSTIWSTPPRINSSGQNQSTGPKQLAIKVWSICDQIKLVKSGKNVFCSTINTFELKIWWPLNPNFWLPVWSWNFIFGQQILWPIVQSWKGFGYHRSRFWPFAPPYKPLPESIEKNDFSIFLPWEPGHRQCLVKLLVGHTFPGS